MAIVRAGYPADSEAFWACHRLAAAELPPPRLHRLLSLFPRPEEVLRLPGDDLRAPEFGLTEKQAARLQAALAAPLPPRLPETTRTLGVTAVTFAHETYPSNLLPLSDAPPLLFVRGSLLPEDRFAVAIVGSRRATHYGLEQARRFADAFTARGLTLVSGGAAGIDTAAHRGALERGGRTISVLGCGVDVAYPAANRALFEQIAATGAVVSEFALQVRPEPWRFPTRNRIIAGVSRATVLIETPADSGALITGRNAAEYGRDVWVVPGPVDTQRSQGGHRLIQDGAQLADCPEDVLNGLGIPLEAAPTIPAAPASAIAAPAAKDPGAPAPTLPANLTPDERALLAQLDLAPRHLEEAGVAASLGAAQTTVAATLLEMKGLVRRLPGNLYSRIL